jgi:hypothetical protein
MLGFGAEAKRFRQQLLDELVAVVFPN